MKLFDNRIAKIISIVLTLLGVISIFIPFPNQDWKTKIIIIGSCILLALLCWIIDLYLELKKLNNTISDLKDSALKLQQNRQYLSNKVGMQQRKLDAFRQEWNNIRTCINAHAVEHDTIKFDHLKEVCQISTDSIYCVGGFSDDDESTNI